MEIFGIGPGELILFFALALVILGPKGMTDMARNAGKFIRKVIKSPIWRDMTTAQREVRDLPKKIIRDAGLEDLQQAFREANQATSQTILDLKRQTQVGLPPDAPLPDARTDPKNQQQQ